MLIQKSFDFVRLPFKDDLKWSKHMLNWKKLYVIILYTLSISPIKSFSILFSAKPSNSSITPLTKSLGKKFNLSSWRPVSLLQISPWILSQRKCIYSFLKVKGNSVLYLKILIMEFAAFRCFAFPPITQSYIIHINQFFLNSFTTMLLWNEQQ